MAYNLLDLRARVRTKIKDTSYSADTIDGFINDAIQEIADLYEWVYFREIDTSGTLTVGNNIYNLPATHDRTSRLIIVHPTDTNRSWNITKYYRNNDVFFNIWPTPDLQDESQPIYWTVVGQKFIFNCPSDLAYLVRHHFKRLPTELTADTDVPDLPISFREAIVLGASYRCEEERQNYDIAGALQNRFSDKVGDRIALEANDTDAGPDVVVNVGQRHQDDWS